MTDQEAIDRVLAGETDAFQHLLEAHQGRVARIVGRRVPPDAVEEVAQDAFVRAFQGLAGFRGEAPFEHWLSRLAVLACHDYWRASHRRHEIPESGLSEAAQHWLAGWAAQEAATAEPTRALEVRELLHWALARLTPAERSVVTLVYLEEMSVKEAAATLGWSQVNVKVRSHRARKKLKKLLDEVVDHP
ncbi:MAG: RNA polymerase sigma factor [Deltaproteobacteria bacterium]|nr:RNA polymerase sigma factor [Deltaproteobacteria bacterium]